MKLETGKKYRLFFPNGSSMDVKLKAIETYSYLPADYIFEYLSGDRTLVDAGSSGFQKRHPDCFPLPEGLLPKLSKIEEI